MKKFLNFLPLLAMIGSFFLPQIRGFITHHLSVSVLGALFAISEALAGIPWVKSNSIAELIVNSLVKVFAPAASPTGHS